MTGPVATDRELDRLLARRLRQLADSLDGSGLQPSRQKAREAADELLAQAIAQNGQPSDVDADRAAEAVRSAGGE